MTRSNDTRIAGVQVAGIEDCIVIGGARVMSWDERCGVTKGTAGR